VTEGKKLVGIITSRDILWTITKKPSTNLKELNVMSVATRKVAVIKPSADINTALQKMKTLNFRRLPVISLGQVIGMITLKDILRVEPSLYFQSGELTKIREEEEKIKKTKIQGPLEGFCENCGAFSELLRVDSTLLCQDCRNEIY